MNIRPIGGIFWKLDASGNLTAFDPSGTVIGKFIGGIFYAKGSLGTTSQNTALTSTTSTTGVSSGFNNVITFQFTGRAWVNFIAINCNNNTASDGGELAVAYNTGNNPVSGGSAIAGTFPAQLVAAFVNNASTAGFQTTMQVAALVTGLTVGTTYTFTIRCRAITGGTFSFGINDFEIEEL